jgi:hypothetical protein
MSFNFFGFGRKRRSTRRKVTRRRKVVRKGSKKGLSRSLLSLCKKYHVKCTKKVGSRRVRKSATVIKKQLRRKIKSLIKRASKFGARKSSFGRHTRPRRVRRTRRVTMPMMAVAPVAVRRSRMQRARSYMRGVGASVYRRRRALGALAGLGALAAGAGAGYRYSPSFRGRVNSGVTSARDRYFKVRGRGYFPRAAFGKRRRVRYRKYHFGSNPPLSNSMGYEFCSNGGGVLGANSTGLFPTPCMNASAAPKAAFGRRRRVGRPRKAYRKRRTTRRRVTRRRTTRRRM